MGGKISTPSFKGGHKKHGRENNYYIPK